MVITPLVFHTSEKPFLNKTTKIYHVPLQNDPTIRSPFEPFDELHVKSPSKKKDSKKDGEVETKKPVRVRIDFAGITKRVLEVPIPAGNYDDLALSADRLFWTDTNRDFDSVSNLQTIKVSNDSPKVESVSSNISSFELVIMKYGYNGFRIGWKYMAVVEAFSFLQKNRDLDVRV